MKILKHQSTITKRLIGLQCDVCKLRRIEDGSFDGNVEGLFATLSADWGYGTARDGEVHTCHICALCYEKVHKFITDTLNGTVPVTSKS